MTSDTQTQKSHLQVRRGDIVLVDLEPVKGSEQGKERPCIVIQNDIGNQYSPTTIIIPLTRKSTVKRMMPILSDIPKGVLKYDSVALTNQIRAISKERIKQVFGSLNTVEMLKLETALCHSLNIAR